MARVLLGVTGGISAYKACELCRLLVRAGHEVTPVLTPGAERFVTDQDLRGACPPGGSARAVPAPRRGRAPRRRAAVGEHARQARAGLADNVLTQLALAFRGPVLAAPAMNTRMWEHPATQANVATLRSRGVELVGPAEGELAEGEVGRRPDERAGADLRTAAESSSTEPARWPADASSSRPAGRASRSTPSATSETARAAGWASRSRARRGGAVRT